MTPDPMTPDAHGRAMPAELAQFLGQVVPPGGTFGHRQHLHLAFLTVRRYGTAAATVKIGQWIRHIAAYERAPQKYNATITRAWTEIVGQHVAADPAITDFGRFTERYPALLDKRLLTRHYSPAVLASAAARTTWAEPDLVPITLSTWGPEADAVPARPGAQLENGMGWRCRHAPPSSTRG